VIRKFAHVREYRHACSSGKAARPGRPDEDVRGGFEHGGWALPYNDSVMSSLMGEGMAQTGALLLGRRTYQDFAGFWPNQEGNPFTEMLDNVQKFVASRTLEGPLPRSNSTLLEGDAGGVDRRTLFMMAAEWRGVANMLDEPRTGQVLTVQAPAPGAGWP